jgi:hypothetical protein
MAAGAAPFVRRIFLGVSHHFGGPPPPASEQAADITPCKRCKRMEVTYGGIIPKSGAAFRFRKQVKEQQKTDAQFHKEIDASVIHALNPRVNRSC